MNTSSMMCLSYRTDVGFYELNKNQKLSFTTGGREPAIVASSTNMTMTDDYYNLSLFLQSLPQPPRNILHLDEHIKIVKSRYHNGL